MFKTHRHFGTVLQCRRNGDPIRFAVAIGTFRQRLDKKPPVDAFLFGIAVLLLYLLRFGEDLYAAATLFQITRRCAVPADGVVFLVKYDCIDKTGLFGADAELLQSCKETVKSDRSADPAYRIFHVESR